MKSVAIIGSRRISESQYKYLVSVAEAFARRGWMVRTGVADGADHAAMVGTRNVNPDLLHTYLPWANYNKQYQADTDHATVYDPKEHITWGQSVYRYHPAPQRLSRGAFSLMARNWGILMHEQPVDAVVALPMSLSDVGGTGEGMRIAKGNSIELFTVCEKDERQRLKAFLSGLPKGESVEPVWRLQLTGGDVTTHRGIIVHQVNCQGVMGSGVAKAIRDKWPIVFEKYKAVASPKCLGRTQFVQVGDETIVANLFGQNFYGRDGKQYTDYEAFRKGLQELRKKAEHYNYPIALPYLIGCGLGGGNWEIVRDMIAEELSGMDVTLYKY